MRFTPLILTGLFALSANAQSGTTSASAPLNSEQAAIIKCIDACQDGDVSCTSKCIAVPNPSDQDVNETNDCVAACPKGNGTESDNAKYSDCVQDCIGQHYFTATTGGAASNPTNAAPVTTTTGVTRTNVVVVSTVVSGSFTTTVTSTSTPSAAPSESGDDGKATSTAMVESTSSAGAAGRVAVGGLGGFLLGLAAVL
ncbi:hypothetical protein B0H65DRAFT_565502 [Neurospora tetraspora]|uniref:Anchored cell wall protein 4 n=1 Tax=Neurospora tetraspora TaxID=94610 RepID=A0AAE0JQY8_9PEZI|nr:hypothetical protein B0H65DRAFT_565502 [Neurospora tetraspora]